MAIVIRTAYNNQGWQAGCEYPYKDPLCFDCFRDRLRITQPSPTDEVCSGKCWERDLCVEYRYGCTPRGGIFGQKAYIGARVFLVYKQPDGGYTLWGVTTVRDKDSQVTRADDPVIDKGWSFIHFDPFSPLPEDRQMPNLTAQHLIGAESWRTGRHRYVDATRQAWLEGMISAESRVPTPLVGVPTPQRGKWATVAIEFPPHIDERLQEIAGEEGRSKEDLIREAIATWLRQTAR